jgi:photosystem II stability/assembly factor-like uncharacterized protein
MRAGHQVLRTTNAGASWRSIGWVAKSWLNDADFATRQVGWACSQIGSAGDGGSIVKTGNAGRTWHVQKRVVGHAYFTRASCPDARRCYVLGTDSRGQAVWATADGGRHWARRRLPSRTYWASVTFPTASVGRAAGSGGSLVRTTDRGRTWHKVPVGTQREDLRDVSFCSSQVGYVVGTYGTVLKTTDGGASWNWVDDALISGFDWSEVECVDQQHIWLLNTDRDVIVTNDGGQTWSSNGAQSE